MRAAGRAQEEEQVAEGKEPRENRSEEVASGKGVVEWELGTRKQPGCERKGGKDRQIHWRLHREIAV